MREVSFLWFGWRVAHDCRYLRARHRSVDAHAVHDAGLAELQVVPPVADELPGDARVIAVAQRALHEERCVLGPGEVGEREFAGPGHEVGVGEVAEGVEVAAEDRARHDKMGHQVEEDHEQDRDWESERAGAASQPRQRQYRKANRHCDP